jgi:hypothetical protein
MTAHNSRDHWGSGERISVNSCDGCSLIFYLQDGAVALKTSVTLPDTAWIQFLTMKPKNEQPQRSLSPQTMVKFSSTM